MVLGIDDLVADRDPGGSGASTGTGGPVCAAQCGTEGCGVCPDTARVEGGGFSIDAVEVSIARYQAWLATNPSVEGQREECDTKWNDSFQKGVPTQAAIEALAAAGEIYEPDPQCDDEPLSDEWPISCVDWCDASAYCKWAGGRLCGEIGGGGIIDVTDGAASGHHDNPDESEWFRACSNGGAQRFPYGADYAAVCNDEGSNLRPVGDYEDCQGGLAGLFDMSGNVAEWEDACTYYNSEDPVQNCLVRGGTWYNTGDEPNLECAAFRDVKRASLNYSMGFRCCYDG